MALLFGLNSVAGPDQKHKRLSCLPNKHGIDTQKKQQTHSPRRFSVPLLNDPAPTRAVPNLSRRSAQQTLPTRLL